MNKYPMFPFDLPERLEVVDPPALEDELSEANSIRDEFILPGAKSEYMVDIVRAFRLARNAKAYIEVGTRDKGNIAWLSKYLDPSALIIDVDIEQIVPAQVRLRKRIGEHQSVNFIEGNCIHASTVQRVDDALAGQMADVIFLDSSHMYSHFMAEIDIYWRRLRPSGVLLVHDVFWEGNDHEKGKAQALEQIDKHVPVWTISMNEPVRRFFLRPFKQKSLWGGVGIIFKP